MIKFYCDVCGKDITNENEFVTVTIDYGYRQEKCLDDYHKCRNEEQWDLCFECQLKLTSQYLNTNLKKYDIEDITND